MIHGNLSNFYQPPSNYCFTDKPLDEAQEIRENDENVAKFLLQRTVNQAWKKRFAEMMESMDAKDLV
jgi:hypothetical protein